MIGEKFKLTSRIEKLAHGEVWMAERRADKAVVLVVARTTSVAGELDATDSRDHEPPTSSGQDGDDGTGIAVVTDRWMQGRFVCEAFAPGPLRTLRQAIREGQFKETAAAFVLGAQIARVLAKLHAKGLEARGLDLDDVYLDASSRSVHLHCRPVIAEGAGTGAGAATGASCAGHARDLAALGMLIFRLVTKRRFEEREDLEYVRRGFNVALLLCPAITPAGDVAINRLILAGYSRGYGSALQALEALKAVCAHLASTGEGPGTGTGTPRVPAPALAASAVSEALRAREAAHVHRQVEAWVAGKTRARIQARGRVGRPTRPEPAAGRGARMPRLAALCNAVVDGGHARMVGIALALFSLLVLLESISPADHARRAVRPPTVIRADAAVTLARAVRDAAGAPTSGANVFARFRLLRRVQRYAPRMLVESSVTAQDLDALHESLASAPDQAYAQMDRLLTRVGSASGELASTSPRPTNGLEG